MARPLRIEYPGALYHIIARGNAGNNIYQDDQDRKTFLNVLAEVVKKCNWYCHAYCLMDNHYHILIETPEANLSYGMRQLNGIYTQRYNRRHLNVGHIFQGRFKSILVDKDNYLLELCRYIALNPVRAKLVELPEKWPWGSYQATSGLIKAPDYLAVDWILGLFGSDRKLAQKQYQKFVRQGINAESPMDDLQEQIILGDKAFVEKVQEMIKDKAVVKEIPRKQRFAGRQNLEELFSDSSDLTKELRNQKIVRAHQKYGYTLKEIADSVGVHYTTISKIVRNTEK
ncbi:MAG: addiction module toxin RelE [Firmicutes bacterium ML8_F2]|jgi:putative transposase|nr:MAG: addiction module toxin RelE [Firmicutes bacterium ML8_F2]